MNSVVRPTIIDVEASGFGPESYPIEIGLALADGARFSCLIRPLPEWDHWDPAAERIHRVSREILLRHGQPPATVAAVVNDLLEERTVYSDGWVVDHPWVERLYDAVGVRRRFSVSPLERILTEAQMSVWHDTMARVTGEYNLQRHRASTDAMIIQETYLRTLAAGRPDATKAV